MQVCYETEDTWGVEPSANMTMLRVTGCSLNLEKQTLESKEIRSDRQIADVRHGNKTAAGDVDFELSAAAFDDMLQATLGGTWATNTLTCGTTTRSFTIEQGFTDTGIYRRFLGMVPDKLSLSMKPNQMVTGKLSFLGSTMSTYTVPADSSITAAATNTPLDAFTGSIFEGGASIATVTGLDFTIDNQASTADVIGQATPAAIIQGRCKVTGTLTAYVPDSTLINKFTGETATTLSVACSSGGKGLTFTFPNLKYLGAKIAVNGEGPVIAEMPFQALYDSGTGTTLSIVRDNS
jgi:hypothetical protein